MAGYLTHFIRFGHVVKVFSFRILNLERRSLMILRNRLQNKAHESYVGVPASEAHSPRWHQVTGRMDKIEPAAGVVSNSPVVSSKVFSNETY